MKIKKQNAYLSLVGFFQGLILVMAGGAFSESNLDENPKKIMGLMFVALVAMLVAFTIYRRVFLENFKT